MLHPHTSTGIASTVDGLFYPGGQRITANAVKNRATLAARVIALANKATVLVKRAIASQRK